MCAASDARRAGAGIPAELAGGAGDTSYEADVTEPTHQALAGTGTGVSVPKFFEIKRQIKGELNFE